MGLPIFNYFIFNLCILNRNQLKVHSSEPPHPHLPKLRGRKKIIYIRLPEVKQKAHMKSPQHCYYQIWK